METKRLWVKILFYAALILITIITIIPIITVLLTAVKSQADFYSGKGVFDLPQAICWDNFVNALTKGNLGTYMKNDIIVSFLKVPLGILIEAMAAFAITRLNIKHSTGIFIFFLLGMMLPMQVALVPINIMYTGLPLTNTYFGLFYVYVGFGISFGILILRGFFKAVPKDIDEAASIDGCNKMKLFWSIILPIAKPAVATLFIMDFLSTWNEYLLASVLVTDKNMRTVAAGLMTFMGEHGADYGMLYAGVLISVIPVILVYIFFQRYFVEGLAGAVKA